MLIIKLPFDRLVRKQRVNKLKNRVCLIGRRNAMCTDFRFSRFFWKTKLDDRRAERNRAFENRRILGRRDAIFATLDRSSMKRGRNRAVAEERRNRTRHETRSPPLRSIGFLISAANAHVHRWMNRCCWSNGTYAPCQNVQRFYVPHSLSRPGTLRMRRIWNKIHFSWLSRDREGFSSSIDFDENIEVIELREV